MPAPSNELPAPGDNPPVASDTPLGRFQCDPFACTRVCCTGWAAGGGIRLTVPDLRRLAAAELLDGVEGVFAPAEDIRRWRADPEGQARPEAPRMRSTDGHCVHYDPGTRRCGIWEHRPMICRTFPYAIDYVTGDGTLHVTYAPGCSLVTPPDDLTPITRGEAISKRYVSVRRTVPAARLGELSAYDRAHIAATLESAGEQAESLDLLTTGRDRLVRDGLGAFLAPDNPAAG